MSDRLAEAAVASHDGEADDACSDCDDCQVDLDLAHLEGFGYLPGDDVVVEVEVSAEYQHEDRNYPLDVRAVGSEAVVADAETTRTGCTECRANAVEKRHAAYEENDDLEYRESEVDVVEHFSCGSYLRYDLSDGRTGTLCSHEIHVGTACHRDYGKEEYENSHTADPVGQGTPHE